MTDNDRAGMRCLMEAQMRSEMELAHQTRLQRYEAALRGIASCATSCGCCRMHAEIAREAVEGKE